MKAGFGVDGSYADVSAASPLPIYDPDATASGTITTTDAVVGAPAGAGALVTGASTAGSLVAMQCPGGDSAWVAEITGAFTGTLYFEASASSTNGTDGYWTNVIGRQTGVVNTVLTANTVVGGLFRGNTSGVAWFRVRRVGASTGTPAIVLRASGGTGAVFLNASIPPGLNLIGQTAAAVSATPTLTNVSATTTTAVLFALNAARLGAVVYNDSDWDLYLKYGTTASPTSFTYKVFANTHWEMPGRPPHTGLIHGIWDATSGTPTGAARCTELTP